MSRLERVYRLNRSSHFFIAVPIPEQIKDLLWKMSVQLQRKVNYKEWTHKEDFHITLSFLGSVNSNQFIRLKRGLSAVTDSIAPFTLQLDKLSYFGKPDQPRVLWVGVTHQSDLTDCHGHITHLCEDIGFKIDKKPYRPHITIGKKWVGDHSINSDFFMKGLHAEGRLEWQVEFVTLYQVMLNERPKYKEIQSFSLNG